MADHDWQNISKKEITWMVAEIGDKLYRVALKEIEPFWWESQSAQITPHQPTFVKTETCLSDDIESFAIKDLPEMLNKLFGRRK